MAPARKRTSTNSSGESQRSMNEATSIPPSATAEKHVAQGPASLSVPRTALRALALRASHNPIEVIVSIFIVVTLAYFQLVHALTTSNFFEPLSREASGMAAASTWSGASGRAVAFWDPAPSNVAGTPIRQGSVLVRKAGQQHWTSVTQVDQIDSVISSLTDGDDAVKAPLRFVVEPFVLADAQTQPAPILETVARKLSAQLLAQPDQTSPAVATATQDIAPFELKDPSSGLVGYGFGRVSSFSRQFWNERQRTLQRADDEDLLGATVTESLAEAAAIANPSRGGSTSGNKRASSRASNKFGRKTAEASEVVNSDDVQLLAIFPDADLRDFFTAGGESDEVRSVRWLGYALWALVMRFWALLKRADSADIFVMLSAYLLMHATFANLFLSMRRFGSNFWLGASVLTSSICAFLCALTMAYLLGVTVDPICLSEALPFLVITVGFEKPFLLTKAVFTHPAIAPQTTAPNKAHPSLLLSALNDSQQAVQRQKQQERATTSIVNNDRNGNDDDDNEDINDFSKALAMRDVAVSQEESFVRALTARLKSEPSLRWSAPQPVPAKEVVVAAVDAVGMQIVRDYAVEIAVMAVGATSGVSGLREFCQLAALILTFDCAFLFAFLVATLTIMVEVHRIKVMRGMKRVAPSTPPNVDSDVPTSSVTSPPSERVSPTSATTAGRRNSSPDSIADDDGSKSKPRQQRPLWRKVVKLLLGKVPFEPERPGARENPVARLKLLLVTTFLTLHSLNLVSTLTTQSAITRHHSTDGPTLYQAVQESSAVLQTGPTSNLVAPMLVNLIKTQPTNVDLFVKVQDPITFVLTHSSGSGSAMTIGSSMLGEVALNASNNGGQVNADLTSSLAAHLGGRSAHAGITRSANASGRASLNVLDSFMSGWTVIVGDPVISKWISLALVISIFLNAFLLKGIATGNAAVADGNAAGAAAFAAARMIGSHLTRQQEASSAAAGAATTTDDKLASQHEPDSERLSQYHRSLAKSASTHTQKSRGSTDMTSASERRVKKPTTDAGESNENVTPQQQQHERFPTTLSLNGVSSDETAEPRAYEEILDVYSDGAGVLMLSDEELILLVQKGKVAGYSLEKALQDHERAVRIRRATISRASLTQTLEHSLVPLRGYDYAQVMGACCENVVGFMPLPLGIAGPLLIDGLMTPIPMATTEGTLVASTSRGCKALNAAGGVTTVLTQDAMTRGPAVEFSTITQAAKAKRWIDSPDGAATIKEAFDSTSRFARLASLRCVMAGRTLYIRFATSTGDAMGMNMVSKGVEKALACMSERFDMTVLSLSGNYCIDKKPSAINWIEGRGKSVCCEAVIPGKTVKGVLKTSVEDLVNLNLKKNLIGSAMAGSIGGFNAHAANIVAAVFLASGQDPAQVVESSMCMTLMEAIPSKYGGRDEPDLLVTVSMPSIEVGTVGGGTILSPQRGILEMLGVAGSSKDVPGANAQRLARIIAAAVMAGELSLMGALSAGHLIQAHMKHNRSVPPTPGNVTPTSSGSINGALFGMAMAQTPSSQGGGGRTSGGGNGGLDNGGTPARFQSPMTPLIAPPVGSGPQSRGSPSNTLSAKDRRSASAM